MWSTDESHRAASWSWASGNCQAEWLLGQFRDRFVQVLGVHVNVSGENPYGEVTNGKLTLQRPIVEMFVHEHGFSGSGTMHRLKTEKSVLQNRAWMDFIFTCEELAKLYISAVIIGIRTPTNIYSAILVTPCQDGSGAYQRIGYADVDGEALGEFAPKLGDEFPVITLV